jgi:hypothetical protein
MKEHEKILVEILGKDAFFSTDFKVTDNVRVLAFTVQYLFTQLRQIQGMMQDEDKDYIAGVELNAIEILKGK